MNKLQGAGVFLASLGVAILLLSYVPDDSSWRSVCFDLGNATQFMPYYTCSGNCSDSVRLVFYNDTVVLYDYDPDVVSSAWIVGNEFVNETGCPA